MKSLIKRVEKLERHFFGCDSRQWRLAYSRALEDAGLSAEEGEAALADMARIDKLSREGIEAELEPVTDKFLDSLGKFLRVDFDYEPAPSPGLEGAARSSHLQTSQAPSSKT